MDPVIYFNRAFRPEREATVSVRSRALNYGLGCFAGIAAIRPTTADKSTSFDSNVMCTVWHIRRGSCACVYQARRPKSPT